MSSLLPSEMPPPPPPSPILSTISTVSTRHATPRPGTPRPSLDFNSLGFNSPIEHRSFLLRPNHIVNRPSGYTYTLYECGCTEDANSFMQCRSNSCIFLRK